MSDRQENHLDQTGAALSALVACIVKTLGELNPTFQPAFEKNLEDIYYRLRDSNAGLATLEMLTSVNDLIKK